MRLARENRAAPDPDTRADASGQTPTSTPDRLLNDASIEALHAFFALLDRWDVDEHANATDAREKRTNE
jgi:hypothetical protein